MGASGLEGLMYGCITGLGLWARRFGGFRGKVSAQCGSRLRVFNYCRLEREFTRDLSLYSV